jgi:hypothetical protein
MLNNTKHEYDTKRSNKGFLKRFFYFLQGKVSLKQFQNPFVLRNSLYPVKGVLSGYKIPFVVCAVLVLSLYIPLAFVVASPGVHVQVPQSPLAPNQPVYMEFFTDPGEAGTIQLDITKPPLLAIFWQSGPIPISGGILYDVTAPGFTDPGTYVVSAYVTLSGGGGNLQGSTTFEVVAGGQPGGGQPGFDYNLEVQPPVTEIGQGEIAHFQVIVIYNNPSYSGTMVSINLTGLGPGMQWHPEPGGHISISTSHETPPGTYHIDIIGEAQGIVRQTVATLIVRGGPEEPPPEEHPEEPPPEEHPPEPPEEHPPEPPEEHPPEPPEEHPPEPPDEYPPEQWEPERWEGEQHEESTVTALLSNPLYLIIIALMVIIVLLIVALMRRS